MILLCIPSIAMCLEFTNTKISNNHKLLQSSSFCGCQPHMMTLKPRSSSPISSSKFLKFRNYGKAPYIVSSYCHSSHINVFDRLFSWWSKSNLTHPVSIKTSTSTLLGVFQIQFRISGVNFSNNISIPHITWHNLLSLLIFNY